tara:strand:+ start:78 stop:686 length:609 start_codon:yes stop_codon:yes gene_type:complete
MLVKNLIVSECDRKEIKNFVEKHHYSKSINGVKSSFCFSVKHCDVLVGGIIYGEMSTTAWKKFAKKENEVLELRRLVLLDECPKNSESRVISKSLLWINKNVKHVKRVVSYADPNYGHTGIIYRASNFNLHSMSAKDYGFKDKETGKVYHSRALRTRYKGDFKPFVKKLRAKLENGLLEKIDLKPKYCFVYDFRRKKNEKQN